MLVSVRAFKLGCVVSKFVIILFKDVLNMVLFINGIVVLKFVMMCVLLFFLLR